MGRDEKLFIKIMCGTKDKSVTFAELCLVLKKLGFIERINETVFVLCLKTHRKRKIKPDNTMVRYIYKC